MEAEYIIGGIAIAWGLIYLSLIGFGIWVIIKLLQYFSVI